MKIGRWVEMWVQTKSPSICFRDSRYYAFNIVFSKNLDAEAVPTWIFHFGGYKINIGVERTWFEGDSLKWDHVWTLR